MCDTIVLMEMEISNKIYNEIFEYLDRKGLIAELVRMFQVTEAERYAELSIDEEGLSLLETIRCFYDKNRSLLFAREVENLCKPGNVVIEAGIGTGILSFVAASCGAKVYGVELNKQTLALANEINTELIKKGFYSSDQISFSLGDAHDYTPAVTADFIISENNYTGMFYEKQISIGNHLIKFLKPKGIFISSGWQDFAFLACSDFPYKPQPKELFVPSALEGVWVPYTQLSPTIQYTNFDFCKTNPEKINVSCDLAILEDGDINSIVVYSKVPMPSGYVIGRYDAIALNNDIVIALPSVKVKKGDVVKLQLEYNCGDDVNQAEISVTKGKSLPKYITQNTLL
jgi:predicted RNA methylase